MKLLSIPAIMGLSFGAALVSSFLSKKHRDKSLGQKLVVFLGGFALTLIVLLALNFGIYWFNAR
ncbi:hypothetical protein ACXIUS_02560 [Bosea thiooxidans]|nr:hypothetical protein [Bosea sp. (in: a-proteobacteria)]